jgi:hypothetical protein
MEYSTKFLLVSHPLSACYLHDLWGAGGGREVKRISVNSLFSAPHPRGGGGERAYFSVNTTCNQHIMAINITYTHPFISDTVKALSSVTF